MDDLKNTITNLTKTITKTSGDFMKSAKISVSISNEEANLNSIYKDIGKKVHEIYAYGGSLGKFFDEKYDEILATEGKLDELRSQLDLAKGTKTCRACGKIAAKSCEFCPKCGASMDGAPTIAPPSPSAPAPAEIESQSAADAEPESIFEKIPNITAKSTKTCAICGTENDMGDKFCLSCGRMI